MIIASKSSARSKRIGKYQHFFYKARFEPKIYLSLTHTLLSHKRKPMNTSVNMDKSNAEVIWQAVNEGLRE